ncbi:MAG: MucR family transcriptional regulator [Mesorhizobium amorphae]|nr:MAG: MucR family transcriptional regulator [Mesorhizobium amorphae]
MPTLDLTAKIVSAYVANNYARPADLPRLLASVDAALGQTAAKTNPTAPKPPASVKQTVFPDHIVSLENGKAYKILTTHLTRIGMTPEQYREKWGLPKDYPMVARKYAALRSATAKAHGLGLKNRAPSGKSK